MRKIKFYETHIFKYSKRKGTRAAEMPDQVSENVKSERSDVLSSLHEKNKAEFEQRWSEKSCQVLFEEKINLQGQDYFVGYTKEYIRTVVPAEENYENRVLTGKLHGAERVEGYLLFEPEADC